ncbi:MAG TPA: helix-turn-helix domain-containing protein [Mycobacteriales bacterium]|nr:helix-turn-helix domain-containing protein [Mycobacteriales bacterium]
MSSENDRSEPRGTDPRALRALAHPVRLDLISALHRDGPLTASQCAEQLGLSPKVCSYHLNLLGKYGLIEETGEGKGRARPWRVAVKSIDYVYEPNEDHDTTAAADEFGRVSVTRDAQMMEQFIDNRHRLPTRWRNVSTVTSNPLRLSAPQLQELGHELMTVMQRYAEISGTATEDTRPVQLMVYAVPVDFTNT